MGQGPMKSLVLRSLALLGLLRPAYRGYERLRGLALANGEVGPDDLPLPPSRLRVRVAGNADPAWFLEGGRLAEETLRGTLARVGLGLEDLASILDFGCGCGRVTRWLAGIPGEVRGSDFDGGAVAWCRTNLPFGKFVHNGLEPPLPFAAGELDLVYAFSVFTHLPVPLQHAWTAELVRVLRPGGLLLLSTHGERYVERLTAAERETFRCGEVVVRFQKVAGTNLCTTFHPPAWVRGELGPGLELVVEVPEGARGNPHQDLFLFRKPRAYLSQPIPS
jgi:SAM-dependent methyltransferase